jgi:hypothetical protein
MDKLRAWAQQPTSVAGLATIFGAVSALLSHQLSLAQAAPLLAGAIVSVALPDNTGAKAGAETLARGIVNEITNTKDKT